MNNQLNKYILGAVVLVALLGGFWYFSDLSKNQSQKKSVSHKDVDMAMIENTAYGHVHALIRLPDGIMLIGTHSGLFKTTDEGKTFNKVEVKGDIDSTDFMNFVYDPTNKILFAGGHDLRVVKSRDNGATWMRADIGIKGTDIHALAINPLETNRIYAYSVDNGVFGTKNGGMSWNRIDDGPENPSIRSFGYMAVPSSMDRAMATNKTTNIGYLWAGTGGGLYSSFACFCGWNQTKGISDNATIYALAPDPVNRSVMLAGTKDGIFKTIDEGKTFSKIGSDISDVVAITFDLSNPKVVIAATSNGMIYTSTDVGENWNKVQ